MGVGLMDSLQGDMMNTTHDTHDLIITKACSAHRTSINLRTFVYADKARLTLSQAKSHL